MSSMGSIPLPGLNSNTSTSSIPATEQPSYASSSSSSVFNRVVTLTPIISLPISTSSFNFSTLTDSLSHLSLTNMSGNTPNERKESSSTSTKTIPREEEKASSSTTIVPTVSSSSSSQYQKKTNSMPFFVRPDGLIGPAALDRIFKWTHLEDYEEMNAPMFTNNLSLNINRLIKLYPNGMRHYENICSPNLPSIKHTTKSSSIQTSHVSYESWIKINGKQICLKMGKVAASIIAKGATKNIRSLHSFVINLETRQACYKSEITFTFRKAVTKVDFKDFLNGCEIQDGLLKKYPNLSIAPPPQLLVQGHYSNSWRKGIWFDEYYNCTLESVLKGNYQIPCANQQSIPFSFSSFLECTIPISHTLTVMHQEGLVHKDLAFKNILLNVKHFENNQYSILPLLIDFNLSRPFGFFWKTNSPCTYWDDLANEGFTSPMTDCYSFAYFLKKSFFSPNFKDKTLTLGSELEKSDFPVVYIDEFNTVDQEQADLFYKNPHQYLGSRAWEKRYKHLNTIDFRNLPNFTEKLDRFLGLVIRLETLFAFFELILAIEDSVRSFNRKIKDNKPDSVITKNSFGEHIKDTYNTYEGLKMAQINKRLKLIQLEYNEKIQAKPILLKRIVNKNFETTNT